MSAWLVSKSHIDMIVQAAMVEGLADGNADELGRMLWRENHLSLAARYGDPVPDPVEYTFAGVEAPLDDFVVYRNLGCYSYQSCEHDGWNDSEACQLIQALETTLELRHAGQGVDFTRDGGPYATIGGRRLPWGIDDLMQAVAR